MTATRDIWSELLQTGASLYKTTEERKTAQSKTKLEQAKAKLSELAQNKFVVIGVLVVVAFLIVSLFKRK